MLHLAKYLVDMQEHYAVDAVFKRAVKSTLKRMVDAGRLESVPGQLNLFRLGGVVGKLSEESSQPWLRDTDADVAQTDRVCTDTRGCAALLVVLGEAGVTPSNCMAQYNI